MVLQVSNPNNVKVYTVSGSGSRSIPDWLERRKKRVLKNDPGIVKLHFGFRIKGNLTLTSRIELIQDFEFPEASLRVKTTKDGRFIMATGVYKPQIRVYEYSEMSMKFDRHTDSENVNFVILSDDWTKSVLLQNDRTIEFHTQGGIYYKTRIPKFGRDLVYHYPSCDLLLGASSHEVYRLNLSQGRFLNSFSTDSTTGVNVTIINPAHQLFGFGTENGTIELWDPRSRSRIGLLAPQLPSSSANNNDLFQVTAMEYRNDGLSLAVGTSTGHVLLYDLRSSKPWLVKDHQYGYPIKKLFWYDNVIGDEGKTKIISADNKIMKIWDKDNGANFTSIEPNTDINDFCVVPDSGLIFVANEGIQIGAFYVPSLGPAPRWCSFLDNLTEEMEENPQQNIYENYKFATRKELTNLGMDQLIGTNVLKPYMHGFFMDLQLYEKAKLIANPFAYADYRERIIKEKFEKERESRIRVTKKLPKVNKELASRLIKSSEKGIKNHQEEGEIATVAVVDDVINPLKDNRFKELFTNPDFEIDENTTEYNLLHPTKRNLKKYDDDDEDEQMKEESESEEESNTSKSDTDSDEGIIFIIKYKVRNSVNKIHF
ncbi:WD40-repeat-containing domain protein [Glomus cerebriforme]|uniref:WD40-repeat-containing domain protein n=1 Tax=Glomus cerebriforme TaxID=658196 RepID=A0A397TE25_9GLOM|nr:WD40-repeat-containing domain protein [Glomus cerebriforme]